MFEPYPNRSTTQLLFQRLHATSHCDPERQALAKPSTVAPPQKRLLAVAQQLRKRFLGLWLIIHQKEKIKKLLSKYKMFESISETEHFPNLKKKDVNI